MDERACWGNSDYASDAIITVLLYIRFVIGISKAPVSKVINIVKLPMELPWPQDERLESTCSDQAFPPNPLFSFSRAQDFEAH